MSDIEYDTFARSAPDSPARPTVVPLAVLLDDKNLDAMLSVMVNRAAGDMDSLGPWDVRAAIVEVLGWEGIHA